MDGGFLEKWASLYTRVAISEAQFKANPLPHMRRMSKQVVVQREAMEEALLALRGLDDFDLAQEIAPTMAPSIVEVATARNRKAIEILHAVIANPC